MNIKIVNPQEDMQGNKKKNIFIALGSNNEYIAHSYVFPYENHHACYAKPRNIFLSIEVPQSVEDERELVKELLFSSALERAYKLKDELWKGLSVRIYGGAFADEKDKIEFLISKGFVNDDAVLVMKADIISNHPAFGSYLETALPQCIIERNLLKSDEDRKAFIDRHNSMFATELNNDRLDYFMQQKSWAVFTMYKSEKIIGESMVYEKDSAGYIESFYITPQMRGTGAAYVLMNNAFSYLSEQGYTNVSLNVWQRNVRAIKFYKKCGFKLTGEKPEVYPGIDVE